MIIKKTVEERVVVTKENAKEILQYVHKDDWRYKFVKAMADGKDVEICTNNNIWKNETEDGYLFSAEESAYRIVEPDTRIDLSKKYSLIIGGRIFLKKHKIENISDLVNLVNEVGFSDYIMDYIWNGKRHPIEEEKGITKYTLLQSLNNFLI